MKRSSTIVAIVSGKGGVGKSVVAVNMAELLALDGHRVAPTDAPLGQSACPVLLNETPEASALDLTRHTVHAEQVLHPTTSGITLVQGTTELDLTRRQTSTLYTTLDDLLHRLRQDHSFVLIDAPGGVDGAVRWALDRADLGLLVLVGEPTAVAGAYRLAKLVWQSDPAYPLSAVVNFADTEAEAESVVERFGKVTEHFTGQTPAFLGWIPFSAHLRRSVQDQTPAVRTPGPVRDAFTELTQVLSRGRHIALEPISL